MFVPAVFLAIHFGFPWFDTVVVLAGMLMLWEWARICGAGRFGLPGWFMAAGILAVVAGLYLASPLLALCLLAAATAAFAVAALVGIRGSPGYLAAGLGLIGAFVIAFVVIRAGHDDGRDLVIWLVCAVWLTDTGAYFAGRAIGGPRLAPRISPRKTWAGLAGGTLCAAVWSVLWLGWYQGMSVIPAIALAVLTSVLAQIGDLSVSVVKRRFGVKDASGLLPGHGGVLDRLDGMLLTAPALAVGLVFLSTEKGWT